MGLFDSIAGAFDEEGPTESTLSDVEKFQRNLHSGALFGGPMAAKFGLHRQPALALQPGAIYVHARRPSEPLPSIPSPPTCGIPSLDAEYRRRSEQLMQEMVQEFSSFSLSGLTWAEQNVKEEETLMAERAAEDAEIARKRFEEDAALAARREMSDSQRKQAEQLSFATFDANREAEEATLGQRWKTKFVELSAALDESFSAHQAGIALKEQRAREEEAATKTEAARQASAQAELARQETQARESARREAERAKLRLSAQPSVRSLVLVAPEHVVSALRFALTADGRGAAAALRQEDRSWWKCLHYLEADGLTPPLKATELAASLFSALDSSQNGSVPAAEAAFALSLLTAGVPRSRVNAACDVPDAPAAGAMVSRAQAAQQVHLCTRVRQLSAPRLIALHATAMTSPATLPQASTPAPAASVEAAIDRLYGSSASLPTDTFRNWLVTEPTVAPLFAPLVA
jgi:hypothetical protein